MDIEKLENQRTTGGNINSAAAMENSMVVPQKKLNTDLPFDPAIPLLLGKHSKEIKVSI